MTRPHSHVARLVLAGAAPCIAFAFIAFASSARAEVGVGAGPMEGVEVIFDGTREMLEHKWTYWKGPGFSSSLPIKWKIVDDPVDQGTVIMTDDPAAAGGKFGAADLVTKKKYRDFRLHIEFLVVKKGGNSGVYLQNRYEIQILDGDKTKHGMGAVINETPAPYHAYHGIGKWNAYDITFRAARFQDGKRSEKAMMTMLFNGIKVHTNQTINQVWGGKNSGIDGGNNEGKGITDTPGGLKLQCEGHQVLYRNIWIKELDLSAADTDIME
jgi:3-keto-disaccharide hydrolase